MTLPGLEAPAERSRPGDAGERSKDADRWLLALLALGLALRAAHYLRDPSIWHDEAALLLNVLGKDFALSFSGSSPNFNAPVGSSSQSLSASGSGTFASDPLPVVPGVPEPASWAMMLGGFGLLGATLRTRKAQVSYSA